MSCYFCFVLLPLGPEYGCGYGCLTKKRLCVFRELCTDDFLVVGECPSVLL